MDLYRDIILDHYHHPRNFGHLENPDIVEEDENVSCGDKINIEIEVTRDKDGKKQERVGEIRFSGEGCAIDQASASMLTEFVKGKTFTEITALELSDILTMLGTELTPSRIKCAMLPLEVLQKAILHDKMAT